MQKKSKNEGNYLKLSDEVNFKEKYIKDIKISKPRKKISKNLIKQNAGITLLALCITIIVILILASITIGTISGDNGILGNAGKAKEDTEISNEKEIISVAVVKAMGKNNRGNLKEDEFQEELNNQVGKEGIVEVAEAGEYFEVLFTESNRYYEVDKDGNIGEVQEFVKDENPGDITVGQNGEKLDGSEAHPYEIWCIEDLVEWSQNYTKYRYSYIKLCKNLDFKSILSYENSQTKEYGDINQDGNINVLIEELQKGEGFMPIQQYAGTFDGCNNIINNLYISKQDDAGFIISLYTGNFKNITINGNINSEKGSGGIISNARDSYIINVISNIKIHAGITAGIIGRSEGILNIADCQNSGNIEAEVGAGGICGNEFRGEMLNCINKGTIKSSGGNNYGVGGLCGNNYKFAESTIIKNSMNLGNIIYNGSKGTWYFGGTGGIIGLNRNTLTIQNSINMGKIESTSYAGAICGMEYNKWAGQEKYELTNSFMLNNVELATGSIKEDKSATVFELEDIQEVINNLNKYINDNDLEKQGWKTWKLGENGYPTF